MDELNEKIKLIRREKDTKIIPENIKKGVNILGIEGVLESGSSVEDIYNNTNITLLQSILYEGNQINTYIRSFYPYNIVSFENVDGYFLLDFSGNNYILTPFKTVPDGNCIIGVYDNCIYVWKSTAINVYNITTAEYVKTIDIPSEYRISYSFGMSNFCFSGNSTNSAKSIVRLNPENDTFSVGFDVTIIQSIYSSGYYASFGDNRYGILNRNSNRSGDTYPATIFDNVYMNYYTVTIDYFQGINSDLSMCIVNGSLYECDISNMSLTLGSLLKENIITPNVYIYNIIDNIYYVSNRDSMENGDLYELDIATYTFSKVASNVPYQKFILTNKGSRIGYYIDGNAYYTPLRAIGSDNEYLMSGKEAYNEFYQVIYGTMPNNGELNYNSSTEEQIIPAGYTSGGTIAPAPLTDTEYDECLELSQQILGENVSL